MIFKSFFSRHDPREGTSLQVSARTNDMTPDIPDIPDDLISQLSEFINSQMGLHFPQNRWKDLRRSMADVVQELLKDHEEKDPVSCIHRLLSKPLTKKQGDLLAKHLTIGETYFFRDKNFFNALEGHVFPRLIASRHHSRNIRMWSAGCCTGEEPYSLAILIDRMIPAWQEWNITLLATDINAGFLQKAEQGIYTRWSFRNTSDQMINAYFKQMDEGRFEFSPALKNMVSFSQINLVGRGYPSSINNTHAMDIILCRNVLMYFEPDVRMQIIGRFVNSLTPGGWLVFSPSESPCFHHSELQPVLLSGATLYRKPESGNRKYETGNLLPDVFCRGSQKTLSPTSPIGEPVPDIFYRGSPNTQLAPRDPSESNLDLYHKALKLANMGKLDEAERCLRQAIDHEKLHPEYHYLLATICQEQGRLKESAKSFRHTLFLDPDFVLAHFHLGNLTLQEGKRDMSEKHLKNARSLLLPMAPEDILPHSEGMTAGQLLEVVQSMVRRGGVRLGA